MKGLLVSFLCFFGLAFNAQASSDDYFGCWNLTWAGIMDGGVNGLNRRTDKMCFEATANSYSATFYEAGSEVKVFENLSGPLVHPTSVQFKLGDYSVTYSNKPFGGVGPSEIWIVSGPKGVVWYARTKADFTEGAGSQTVAVASSGIVNRWTLDKTRYVSIRFEDNKPTYITLYDVANGWNLPSLILRFDGTYGSDELLPTEYFSIARPASRSASAKGNLKVVISYSIGSHGVQVGGIDLHGTYGVCPDWQLGKEACDKAIEESRRKSARFDGESFSWSNGQEDSFFPSSSGGPPRLAEAFLFVRLRRVSPVFPMLPAS